MDQIRVAGIIEETTGYGPRLRFVVLAQGCKRNCYGCNSPETHPFDGGKLMSIDEIVKMISNHFYIRGVTFSGGEPFEQAEGFAKLAAEIRKIKPGPRDLDIVTYSGYTFDEICERAKEDKAWKDLLLATDYLIDDPFIYKYRSNELAYRGSYNQLILDVKKSLKYGRKETCLP